MDSQDLLFEREKKRNHDVAYLIIVLAALAATFAFATFFVNILLSGIPIP